MRGFFSQEVVTADGRSALPSGVLVLMLAPGLMAPDVSDADLARLIATAGASADEAAGALFRRYAPRIQLYGLKHLKDRAAADDLAQQVMLRVLEGIRAGRVEDPACLPSFIFGTCRHVSWEIRRADQRQRKIERASEGLQTDTSPPEHSQRDVLRLIGCMQSLPEREAQLLRMSFLDDRPTDEIAARLGLSAGNVRVIRCRALAKVASCMGREPVT
jgi:RNA polymerase sigma-70 factor, ECF subfamily